MHGGLAVDGVGSTQPCESEMTVDAAGSEHARAHEAAGSGLLVRFLNGFGSP